MGFFSNFFTPTGSLPIQQRETTPGTITTTDPDDSSNQPVMGSDWQAQVVRPYGKQSLLIPAWFRGVSLLMQTMGQMTIQYQRMDSDGANFVESKWGDGKRLNYLLQVRPNPLMTASVMQEQIEYRKIYYGNAFVYIERDEFDWPKALWLCTGGGYNPITDMYTLTYNGVRGPRIRFMTESRNVLHFKNHFLDEGYYMGIPTLDYAFKALEIAATADEQALQDVAKGGRQKIILQQERATPQGTRNRANRGELKRMRDQFASDWSSSNDVLLLSDVANPTVISQTSQQLQMLETRAFSVTDLSRILGVPRIMMMEDQGSNYKMPEHATQEFMLRTIQPRIREHEDELNSKLLTTEDFGRRRIHVCELALRRLDAKGQAEIDKMHLEAGWSVNELRAAYDLPNIPNGDAHYVSTNLAEVGSEKLRGTSATPKLSAPANGNANGNGDAANGNANGAGDAANGQKGGEA